MPDPWIANEVARIKKEREDKTHNERVLLAQEKLKRELVPDLWQKVFEALRKNVDEFNANLGEQGVVFFAPHDNHIALSANTPDGQFVVNIKFDSSDFKIHCTGMGFSTTYSLKLTPQNTGVWASGDIPSTPSSIAENLIKAVTKNIK